MLGFLLFTFVSGAAPHAAKLSCMAKELAARDCRLTSGDYDLRLLDKTIAWNDGTWRTVDPMPLSGEGVGWEKMTFAFMSGRPIVQMWLWDKPQGEARVQSLHWYVADAEKRKFTVLAEGVVRKRHLKVPLQPPVEMESGKVKGLMRPAPAPVFIHDAMEPHGLKVMKNGVLEWTLGRDKKLIEKVKHGI